MSQHMLSTRIHNEELVMAGSIGVQLSELASTDTEKIRKILQMSISRKRKYHLLDERKSVKRGQILITSDLNLVAEEGVTVVTFGGQLSNNRLHLRAPLMSIRVLRLLDGISIPEDDATVDKQVLPKKAFKPSPVKTSIDSKARIPEPKPNTLTKVGSSQQLDRQVLLENESIEAVPTEEQSFPSYRVLIVDDSALIHKALEIELDKAAFGSTKSYVESGQACLDLTSKEGFDVTIQVLF